VFKQSGALPLSLTSVKAYQQNSNITVEWGVENEMNVKQYIVERSADGQSFTPAATLTPLRNNGSNAAYQWIDANEVSGNNYYRVLSIDFNGKQQYSSVVKVFIGNVRPAIRVYPNPVAKGNINIQFVNQPKGIYGIKLINKPGQVIMIKQIKHDQGSSTETMQIDKGMAHGTYQLEITRPDGNVAKLNVLY
jgi:hypothetical protein